ncbi:MAG: NAD(P)-dependent oxidoreductase [Planctomycetota bacterium]|nr:MAG: NAD(P)-dependent oxidoreductase [Planctomycetota bacterium]REJ97373.1 MAG: NAD(P)-dependent oxidoreductase [Planctomycetota bacterium]REK27716.1 MAG: NAD(P)-dependent oxidoreductase [Planctomycetota bacterium]REK38442.1 MAG: NAD(P)-dependent oxidoreductase [Planctomycetota bacterium]
MKHLVTGGSGFLGNLIARRLCAQGEEVRVLDVWEDPSRPAEIEFIKCDVRDREGVARAMSGVGVVHHNAALVPITRSGGEFWQVNAEGSRQVAEAAVAAGVEAFIYMNSCSIYGMPEDSPITDASPLAPFEIYGRSKLGGEVAVSEVCQAAGLPLISIRPRTILAAGRSGIFRILFEWIHEGKNVYVIGSGNNPFQFLHAEDLMDAYLLAYEAGQPGLYNVGTDRYGTLREMLENLVAYAGSPSKVRSVPAWAAVNALRVLDWMRLSPLSAWHYRTYHLPYHFDVGKLLKLGWQPRYSNDEMLQESYDWYLAHREQPAADSAASAHRRGASQRFLKLIKKFS